MSRLIILLAALITVASARVLDSRIVGGSDAGVGDYPYQISMRSNGQHSCGGSILNEYWILTAAHCVVQANPNEITIVTGTNDLYVGGDTYNVRQIKWHNGFSMQHFRDDVALIQLTTPIVFGQYVQKIVLDRNVYGSGQVLTLSGWGLTSFPGNIPRWLQAIGLTSIDSYVCNQEHQSTGLTVGENQICTWSNPGYGACQGDSGGPLVSPIGQVGIVSWGKPCAKGAPDVFTRVSSYAEWINSNMN